MRRYKYRLTKSPLHGMNGEESYEVSDREIMAILARQRGETEWAVHAWPHIGQPENSRSFGGFRRRCDARAMADRWLKSQRALVVTMAKAQAEHAAAEAKRFNDLKENLDKLGFELKIEERFGGYLPTPGEEQKGAEDEPAQGLPEEDREGHGAEGIRG